MLARRFWVTFSILILLAPLTLWGQVNTLVEEATAEEPQDWLITGPPGGDVRVVVTDPTDSQRLFIGTADGQIYRSTDGGKYWSLLRPGLNKPSMSVDNIVIDPQNPKTIYAGLHGNDLTSGGVYRSTDGGETWRSLTDMENRSVRALTISPSDNSVLVAGALDGVFRSIDRGLNWTRITPPNHAEIKNIESVAIDPRSPDTIYAGTFHLAWKTTDGGENWFSIKDGMLDDSDVFAIEIDRTDPEHVLASACSGIYMTRNGGKLWKKVDGIPFSARRTRDIIQNPAKPNQIFAGTTEGLWVSTDGGDTWMQKTSKRLVINSISIHRDQPDRVILGTDDKGILISMDSGENFVAANEGFINRQIAALLPDLKERNRIYAGVIYDGLDSGVYLSEDGGRTWQQSINGMGPRDVYTLYQPESRPEVIYAGTNFGIYESVDRGLTWTRLEKVVEKPKPAPRKATRRSKRTASKSRATARRSTKTTKAKAAETAQAETPPPNYDFVDSLSNFVLNLSPTPDGKEGLLAATWEGLYRSYDPKKGWERVKIGDYQGRVYVVTTHTAQPEVIYAGTSQGLYVSRDNGQSWNRVSGGPLTDTVQAIALDPKDPNLYLVGTRRTVYQTTDGGENWMRRGGGLPWSDYSVISINPNNPQEIIVSAAYSGGGIYYSRDRGKNWLRIDSGLPSQRLWSVAYDPFEPNRIYAGSFSGGIYILNRRASEVRAQ